MDKKIICLLKRVSAVLFALGVQLVLIVSSEKLLADDSQTPESTDGQVSMVSHIGHEMIHNSQWMLMPLISRVAGGVASAKADAPVSITAGVITGTVLGGLDEIYNTLTRSGSYLLSAGVMGAASASNFQTPYHLNYLCGFVAGALVASGQLESMERYLAAPVSGAVSGAILGGVGGTVAGGIAGTADEIFSACNLTQTKPVTTVLTAATQLKILAPIASSGLGSLPLIGSGYSKAIQQLTIPYL